MPRKSQEITVISYVRRKSGETVRFEDLTPEERVKAATWIKTTWLNELYRGVATFYPVEEVSQ